MTNKEHCKHEELTLNTFVDAGYGEFCYLCFADERGKQTALALKHALRDCDRSMDDDKIIIDEDDWQRIFKEFGVE